MSPTDELWAKGSPDGKSPGESLVAHTLEVVQRVVRLRDRAPYLADLGGDPRFWHRLGLSAALHDLGKADPRFQKMLREAKSKPGLRSSYDQRHEVVSLAWLDWALGNDPHHDRVWLAAIIGSHHRDHSLISEKYSLGTVFEPSSNIYDLLEPIPNDLFAKVADLFLQTILPAVRETQLLDPAWQPPLPWQASNADKNIAEDSISRNLRCWERWMQGQPDHAARRLGILARGTIFLADHAGSAHEDFRRIDLLRDTAATTARLAPPKGYDFYPHQDEAAERVGHSILVAPTGSGKTEAALRWAARQYAETSGHPPLFYVLPFKASMNAMQRRLVKAITPETTDDKPRDDLVALQHSSALQVLYHQLMDEKQASSSAQAAWLARRQQNLGKLHTTPVRVLSPYQILRAAYQLKGHEAIWTDAAGGLFIFDEIHAYEAQKLARILEMLRFLVDRLGAKAFVMTATMPRPILDRIAEILKHPPLIKAADATYKQFRRHRLKLCETGLLDDATVTQIVTRIRNKEAVLCVATTVKRAQELQKKLRDVLKDQTEVKLLHSRFTGEDRNELETQVRDAVATNAKADQRKNIVLVATQVVEVSLDVDFDVLFTDPAPIEALLQRFGRVNRSRRAEPHDVIVCTVVDDSQPVYCEDLVIAAIAALRSACNTVIDESQVQGWIDNIYAGPIGDKLSRDIEECSRDFREKVLDQLVPFETDDKLEEMFYEQFDGAEVIPRNRVEKYKAFLETEQLRASSLTVPISHSQLCRLRREGRLLNPAKFDLPSKSPFIANVAYSSTMGLELTLPPEEENT